MDYIWTLALAWWPVSRNAFKDQKLGKLSVRTDNPDNRNNHDLVNILSFSYDFSICVMLTLGRLKILETFQTFCQLNHSIITKQWKRLFLLDFLTIDLLLYTDKNWIFIPCLWLQFTIQYNARRYFSAKCAGSSLECMSFFFQWKYQCDRYS